MTAALLALLVAAEPGFCDQRPTKGPSRSVGAPSKGSLEGGKALEDSTDARVLPRRHKARCLNYGVARLVDALAHAGQSVRAAYPGSPPLGVGDLAQAKGGPIPPYSRSHQAGRDVDLAYYAVDASGAPLPVDDLWKAKGLTDGTRHFDLERNWALVVALASNPSVEVRWIFVSDELRAALLAEGAKEKAAPALISRAEAVLHQPSDAPPHDDHFHLRIRCTAEERAAGCRD